MMISLKNISYNIDNKKIIDDINLKVDTGSVLSIIGPNGAGKSTLIKLISGDIQPSVGSIFFGDTKLDTISLEERASMRSVMSQSQSIIYNYKVKEIIEMGWIEESKKSKGKFQNNLDKVAKECSISNIIHRKFNSLSGGEQRRVHLARTLIQLYDNKNKYKYIILDEPNANLDPLHAYKLTKVIKQKSKEGYGVIMVLHNINLAYQISDKVLLINKGKVFKHGPTKSVINKKNIEHVYKIPILIQNNNITIQYEYN
tara:strand:- start:774 stop:1544 length:771 start_codon:yes stop_codon:yes gene_type:complete